MPRELPENERPPTEGPPKRSQDKVSRENRVKRMVCREKEMSRRSQAKEMPKYRDAKKKKCQRSAAEEKMIVRREERARSRASELSTGRAAKSKRFQRQTGSRESGIIRQGCREKDMSRRKRRPDKHLAPERVDKRKSSKR